MYAISAYGVQCLVAGCWGSSAGQQGVHPGRGMLHDCSHAKGEHVNRGREMPSFCPTLQVLDISTLSDAADINPVIKFLPHTLHTCSKNLST